MSTSTTVTPLRALIVEDLEDDAHLIARTLKDAGYQLVWERVETADAMREKLQRAEWDIVICDYNLPSFSGIEAIEVLQSSGLDVPLIVISGTVGEEVAVDTMRAGARDFVMKHRLVRLVPAVKRELTEAELRRQRRDLEQELRKEQGRFRALVEQSSEVILVIGKDKRIAYESPSAERVLGYPADTRIGKSAMEHVHPGDIPVLEADFEDLMSRPEAARLREFRFRHRDGRWLWLEGVATNLSQNRHVQGIVANIRDITERKQAEQALEESRQRLQAILEHSPALIYITDVKGRFIVANRLFEQKFGRAGQRVLGKNLHDVFPEEVARERRAHDFAVLSADAPVTREESTEESDGRHTYLTLKFPVRDARGYVQGICGISTDITERKALESQFLHAQKMEAFGQLAGGVAHDFNNILTVILIQLNLLEAIPDLPPEVNDGMKEIEDNIKRATALTRQLLLFSRRQVVQMKNLDINQLLGGLSNMLRRLLGENIEFTCSRADSPARIYGDPGMIEQVVVNLCVNARDAMPHGGQLELNTSIVETTSGSSGETDQPGRFVCLEVRDTGCGMDEATLKRIYEPFFTTKEVGKGTGLGLATVYGIVKQHQGSIQVDSEVGHGTTFRILLPLISETDLEGNETAQPVAVAMRGTETLLLVEDEAAIRHLVARTLRNHGYHVHEAANATEALRVFDTDPRIELLLTDMVMPGEMTGLELAFHLLEAFPRLRVIVATGHSDQAASLTELDDDRILVLNKPFEAPVLLDAVRRALAPSQEVN